VSDGVILRNAAGVVITETTRVHGHYTACGASCECGEPLIVAPPVYHPEHKKGDPVMVCCDHGVHGYRFSELVLGQQPKGSAS
jgi:hypothetical protein